MSSPVVRARTHSRLSWVVPAVTATCLVRCALENTGTNTGVRAGPDDDPYHPQGTGGFAQAAGGAAGSQGVLVACGNGIVETGEVCDAGSGVAPPRNLCVDCQIDSVMLYSVAGTTTPPSYADSDGHLHLYYLADYHTYDDAAASCGITGAYLITIRNDTEVSVASDLLGSNKGWVGAQKQGTPQWGTGEPWDYEPPGGYVADSPADVCIVFDAASGQLQDANCTELKQGICEWVAPGSS